MLPSQFARTESERSCASSRAARAHAAMGSPRFIRAAAWVPRATRQSVLCEQIGGRGSKRASWRLRRDARRDNAHRRLRLTGHWTGDGGKCNGRCEGAAESQSCRVARGLNTPCVTTRSTQWEKSPSGRKSKRFFEGRGSEPTLLKALATAQKNLVHGERFNNFQQCRSQQRQLTTRERPPTGKPRPRSFTLSTEYVMGRRKKFS